MRVCDVDGGSKGIETVTVSFRGRTFVVDLCENETKVLETWEAAGSHSPRKRAAKTKPQGHSVVAID